MSIKWTEDLAVGVRVVDDQHKELFGKVDELFNACKVGESDDYIKKLLYYLNHYAKHHFSYEENVMFKYDYPQLNEHRKEHEWFVKRLGELSDRLDNSNGNLLVILDANSMIVDWLRNHISVEDKKIGKYVNANS